MKPLLFSQFHKIAGLQNLLFRKIGKLGVMAEILKAHCDFVFAEVFNEAQNLVPCSLQGRLGSAPRASDNFLSSFVGEYFYFSVAKSADDLGGQFGWKVIDLDQIQSPICPALNALHPIGARVENNDSFGTILNVFVNRLGGAVAFRSPHSPLC